MKDQIRACILSVSGPVLTDDEKILLSKYRPWGVILMGRSCVSRTQVRTLVFDIWNALERACLIFIDQEGGRVARLKAPEWPLFPSGEAYSVLYDVDPEKGIEAAWLGHRLIAHELANLSIHADCAPVLDVPSPNAHDIIGDRAFGDAPEKISALGRAALQGLSDGGVAGVIKHIPGHGRAAADSHLELPVVTAGDNELSRDLAPFQALCDAPMAMTAHVAYEAFDPGVAATVSPKVVRKIIRDRIGFNGLLMSDDLGMKALGGSLSARVRASIAAGCDVVLHCAGFEKDEAVILEEMLEIAEAAPELVGKAQERAVRAEIISCNCDDFDAAEGWRRFKAFFPEREQAA